SVGSVPVGPGAAGSVGGLAITRILYSPRVGRAIRLAMQMTGAPTGGEWAELARRFEAGGYDAISLPDHLGAQFAPVPALAAVAMVTERVRLSMFVLANDFRNPAVLAKEITTLDVLSGGRVELGLGAGWHAAEYAAQGVAFD